MDETTPPVATGTAPALPSTNAATAASPQAATGWRPPEKSKVAVISIGALTLVAVLAILYAWGLPPFGGVVQRTENAYVRGQVTIISPQVGGYVTQVAVRDFERVTAGQPVATIDDRVYVARVDQARANVAAQEAGLANAEQSRRAREAARQSQDATIATAQAQLVRAQADMRRAETLVADGSVSARERDQTRATLLSAQAAVQQARAGRSIATQDVRTVIVGRSGLEAGVDAAKAQLRLAEIDLENTIVRAPVDGQMSEIGVRQGALVSPGTQLMFLVPQTAWVVANFKEAQTARMQIGQAASFSVDALSGAKLTGHIESIAPAAGSEFTVIKSDNATGNFVKVAQRIAVRIGIDPGQTLAVRLRPGMSVEVGIDTGAVTGPGAGPGSVAMKARNDQ